MRLLLHSLQANEWDWNRGALVNYYSSDYEWGGAPGADGSGPDNNGNLRRAQHWVPHDDTISGHHYTQQTYSYDHLNRLASVAEVWATHAAPAAASYVQAYTYDRWGNRLIDASATSGLPVIGFERDAANPAFREVAAPSNRLYAPGDGGRMPGQKLMGYDAAGHLVYDSYTGGGARTYDAEGRMTSARFTGGQGQTALFTYDAEGRRVKRQAGAAAPVWQVYGVGGELLAEYAANASPTSPDKDYGYRAGELLVTAEGGGVRWLVSDQLGTPRMVVDQTGGLGRPSRSGLSASG